MQQILAFYFFLFSTTVFAGNHHVPENALDHGPNIPTVGSSLFDKIYSSKNSNGKVVYDIPYPLENFVEKVTNMDAKVVHSMFPFSRSLQRPQDYSYDPIENPRLVFSPKTDSDSLTRGKMFFGFVKAKDQLEVISYNDEAGRYEYQIIVDYSYRPKAFYVDRGKCLSCHQGQAGIFSPPGWQDSTTGPMRHLIFEKLGLVGNDAQKKKQAAELLFGPFKSDEQIATFDSLVRESNDIALDERTWVYGCHQDTKCRLGLLINTLSPNSSQASSIIKYAKEVIDQSDLKQKQIYFSSFLTSTDIGVTETINKYGSISSVVNSPDAILEIIGNLYTLPSADNPATKRPLSLAGKDLLKPLASFFNSDKIKLKKAIPSTNKISEILINLYNNNHKIFHSDAINKLEIMNAILKEVNSPEADTYAYWINKETPEKKLFKGGFPPVFQTKALNIFSRYCHQCHAAGFKFPPQFLLGDEKQVVKQITQLKDRLLYKLTNQLMPPNKDDQELLVDSGDYDKLIEYLENL